jgi:hypothetical protein
MMNDSASKTDVARRHADALFDKAAQRDSDLKLEQRQLQQRETEKLLRLRSLRLAKEAAERQIQKPAERKPAPVSKARTQHTGR